MKTKTFLIWLEGQKSFFRSPAYVNVAKALQAFSVLQLQRTASSQSETTCEASHQLLLWLGKKEDSFPCSVRNGKHLATSGSKVKFSDLTYLHVSLLLSIIATTLLWVLTVFCQITLCKQLECKCSSLQLSCSFLSTFLHL